MATDPVLRMLGLARRAGKPSFNSGKRSFRNKT